MSQVILMLVLPLLCSLLFADAKERPRVFITDSQSWQISGGFGGSGDAISGSAKGGARPAPVCIADIAPIPEVTHRMFRKDRRIDSQPTGDPAQSRLHCCVR